MYCKHCGTENKNDAVFCKHCGERIAEPATRIQEPQAPVMAPPPVCKSAPEFTGPPGFSRRRFDFSGFFLRIAEGILILICLGAIALSMFVPSLISDLLSFIGIDEIKFEPMYSSILTWLFGSGDFQTSMLSISSGVFLCTTALCAIAFLVILLVHVIRWRPRGIAVYARYAMPATLSSVVFVIAYAAAKVLSRFTSSVVGIEQANTIGMPPADGLIPPSEDLIYYSVLIMVVVVVAAFIYVLNKRKPAPAPMSGPSAIESVLLAATIALATVVLVCAPLNAGNPPEVYQAFLTQFIVSISGIGTYTSGYLALGAAVVLISVVVMGVIQINRVYSGQNNSVFPVMLSILIFVFNGLSVGYVITLNKEFHVFNAGYDTGPFYPYQLSVGTMVALAACIGVTVIYLLTHYFGFDKGKAGAK